MAKFNTGDLVEIVGMRHKGFANENTDDCGKLAIVIASYQEQYGGGSREQNQYSLNILPDEGHSSWHDASELRLIKPSYMVVAGFIPYEEIKFKVNQGVK